MDGPQEIFVGAVRTVEDWNGLPEEVKTSRNGEEFRNKLKKL
jgi:hypothetical protein